MAVRKYSPEYLKAEFLFSQDIPEEMIPEEKRAVYRRRRRAVEMYINGFSCADIKKETGIDHTRVVKLIERCLRRREDGSIYGYSALIPNKVLKEIEDEPVCRGLFKKLLTDHPSLADYIVGCWHGDKKYTRENRMSMTTLHRDYFLDECKRLGVRDYEYPFNVASKAYYALREYIIKYDRSHLAAGSSRMGDDERRKFLSTGVGDVYIDAPVAPYGAVQIDGHRMDIPYVVEIKKGDGTVERVAKDRFWFLAVISVQSRCLLGYSLSLEKNYNQFDVLDAIINSILPHKQMDLTVDGFEYPENGGFPSTAFPELRYALFDRIMLDNAKAHLAVNVASKVTGVLKCVMDYGSVATPETRGIIERFFGSIETRGFHKLEATTGSNPRDPKRRDAEKVAVRDNLTFDLCKELLEMLCVQYNNTPHSSLDGETPLESLKKYCLEYGMMPSIADEDLIRKVERLNYITEKRVVVGGKNGTRPYVTYLQGTYRGYELSSTNKYLRHKITLEIDPRDISCIEAYDEDGTPIGLLRAAGEYGKYSHSIKTRKLVNKAASLRGLKAAEMPSPITVFQKELNKRAKKDKRAATQAEILRREIGEPPLSENPKPVYETTVSRIPAKGEQNKALSEMSVEERDHLSEDDMYSLLFRR